MVWCFRTREPVVIVLSKKTHVFTGIYGLMLSGHIMTQDLIQHNIAYSDKVYQTLNSQLTPLVSASRLMHRIYIVRFLEKLRPHPTTVLYSCSSFMRKHTIAAAFSMSCNELLNTVLVSQYQGQGTDMSATEEGSQPGVFITMLLSLRGSLARHI